jgi:hypothetical protein
VLDAVFGPEFIIVTATRDHERQGIDRFFVHRRDGRIVHRVDFKTDEAAGRTGNLALEPVSVVRKGRREAAGWVHVMIRACASALFLLALAGCATAAPPAARPIAQWSTPLCRGHVPVHSAWDDDLRTALAELRAAAGTDLRAWREVTIAAVDRTDTASHVCGREGRATITVSLAAIREARGWSDRADALRFMVAHELAHLALPHANPADALKAESEADARGIFYVVRAGYDCANATTMLTRLRLVRHSNGQAVLDRACETAKRGARP